MVNCYMVRNIFILKNPDGFNRLYENAVSALFFMSIRIVLFSLCSLMGTELEQMLTLGFSLCFGYVFPIPLLPVFLLSFCSF